MPSASNGFDELTTGINRSFGGRVDGQATLVLCYQMMEEMMRDRGLRLAQRSSTVADLRERIGAGKAVLEARGAHEAALVFFDAEERTSVKLVRSLKEQHPEARVLIASIGGPTPFTKRHYANEADVEFWKYCELLMNPTRHEQVPRHWALAEDEVRALRERQCVRDDQLPVVLTTDRIVRWYAFPRGTVVAIRRVGYAQESGMHYRRVV